MKGVRLDLAGLMAVVRSIEDARSLPADDALSRIEDSVAAMLRPLDDAPLDEPEREALRAFLRPRTRQRTSGIDLTRALCRRQRETLEWLLTGASEKEIAHQLDLSVHTVHQYVKRIYRCFGVRSRAQLMAARLRAG